MSLSYQTCTKCGRTLKETEFFKMKTGGRYELCKDCLCQYIDNRKPETFKWILEAFDVPYIEKKWMQMTNDKYKKDPGKFGPKSVIGTYLRTMNMTQYKDLHYEDSDDVNQLPAERKAIDVPTDEEYEQRLLDQLNSGVITETQYNTLTRTNTKTPSNIDENGFLIGLEDAKPTEDQPSEPQEQAPQYQFDSSYWTDQLDDSDIDYLMLKWGTMYTPEQ